MNRELTRVKTYGGKRTCEVCSFEPFLTKRPGLEFSFRSFTFSPQEGGGGLFNGRFRCQVFYGMAGVRCARTHAHMVLLVLFLFVTIFQS